MMQAIKAESHPLVSLLHKPTDKQRMIMNRQPIHYSDWLKASAKDVGEFLRA
jgi:hypothetical protein